VGQTVTGRGVLGSAVVDCCVPNASGARTTAAGVGGAGSAVDGTGAMLVVVGDVIGGDNCVGGVESAVGDDGCAETGTCGFTSTYPPLGNCRGEFTEQATEVDG
jgi:hypothetical protein